MDRQLKIAGLPMTAASTYRYDAATVISQGRRDRQEDAIAADFQSGSNVGFVVLADGMGGHAAGDVASKIVVTEVFSELKLRSGDTDELESQIRDVLENAAYGANACVGAYAEENGGTLMGATLLAPVLIEDRLFWISVGDSPLYLVRDGAIRRLNDEHAVGSQVDYLVENGLMRRDEALNHPEQNSLTSVIIGAAIPQIDCPKTPFALAEGDVIVAASDGLLVLEDDEIETIVNDLAGHSAEEIGSALLQAVTNAEDPDQDNVSIGVIRLISQGAAKTAEPVPPAQPRLLRRQAGTVTIFATVSGRANAAG